MEWPGLAWPGLGDPMTLGINDPQETRDVVGWIQLECLLDLKLGYRLGAWISGISHTPVHLESELSRPTVSRFSTAVAMQ